MSRIRFRTPVWTIIYLIFLTVSAAGLYAQTAADNPAEAPAAQQPESVAQEPAAESAPVKPAVQEEELFDMQSFLNFYQHRVRIRFGGGLRNVSPGILNESGPTWFKNSFYRAGLDPEVPFVFPVKTPSSVPTAPVHTEISYGWRNRLEVSLLRHSNATKYGRSDPTSVDFITPGTSRYYTAWFEGVRLLRYEETSHILRGSYLFPLTQKIMIGPAGGGLQYLERNEISYGSYSVTRHTAPDPNIRTWSLGASASADYRMNGAFAGALFKFNPLNWLELRGSLEFINRSGSFNLGGIQILTQENAETGAGQRYSLLIPFYKGSVTDTGIVTLFEATLRFCRFSIDTGVIYNDYKRKYRNYWGDTVALGDIDRRDYSARSSGLLLGFSEMSQSFKHSSAEFYIRPGVSFHFE